MSLGVTTLHSHSALERELKFPKDFVLVDTKYGDTFDGHIVKPFKHAGMQYIKVPTILFVRMGGIFKNLSE